MRTRFNESGGAKLIGLALVAAVAIAGVAGAVMFRSANAPEQQIASAPVQVQGTSFNDPAPSAAAQPATASAPAAPPASSPAPASPPRVSAPAAPSPDAPASSAASVSPPASTAAVATKAVSASDIPADISKIPSATPVAPTQVASAAGGSPAPQPATGGNEASTGDYKEITFQVLAGYKYIEPVPREGAKPEEIEKERKKNQIPAEVMALTGSKAMVEGWMVPMQVDDNGGVKSFVLVKTQPQCCFGDTQKMNEWIDVTMPAGKTADFNVDRPVKAYGTLEVGEKIEDGFVLSIYRMKAEKVSG